LYEQFPDIYRKYSKKRAGIENEKLPIRMLKDIIFSLKREIRSFLQHRVTQGYWK